MSFFNFFGKNKILFYSSLTVLIILLVYGTVALRGKSPTKDTYCKVGGLDDITSIHAYEVRNDSLLECDVSEIRTDEKLFLQAQRPAFLIQLYINQSVLDSEPNILALGISVNGSRDFAYTLRVWKGTKATNVTTFHNTTVGEYSEHIEGSEHSEGHYDCIGRRTLYTKSGLVNLANLQIYQGLEINRTENAVSDLIELLVTDDYGHLDKKNRMEHVEINDLAFIREKEGRVPPQTFGSSFVLLSVYFLLILIFLPLLLLKKKGKSALQVILILGFLLRVAIAPFTSHTFDILGCKRAVRTYYEQGELTLFTTWTSPPTWFFTLIVFYSPYVFLRALGVPDFRVFYQPILAMEVLFIKLPLILSDVLSAYLIYKICKKRNLDEGVSRLAAAVFIFNPFCIHISSVWGMFDSLAVSFALLGLYFFVNNRYTASSLIWGLGVKWYTLGFIPLLSIISFYKDKKEKTKNRLLNSILIVVIGFGVFASLLIIPHILNGDFSYLKQVLDFRLKIGGGGEDRTSVVTFFGPILWRIFEKAVFIHPFPNFFFYTFGPLYTILLVVLFNYLRKSNSEKADLFRVFNNATIATLFLFYLTYPQLTPQCVLWILPSLIFAYFVFHRINAIPLVVISFLVLPYLDTAYFVLGFSGPLSVSLIQAISGQLECTFGALLFSVAVNFLLKTFYPKLHIEVSVFGKHLLGSLSQAKMLLLYLGVTVVLFLQVCAIFYMVDVLRLSSVFMLAPLAITVTLQTLILITIDKP